METIFRNWSYFLHILRFRMEITNFWFHYIKAFSIFSLNYYRLIGSDYHSLVYRIIFDHWTCVFRGLTLIAYLVDFRCFCVCLCLVCHISLIVSSLETFLLIFNLYSIENQLRHSTMKMNISANLCVDFIWYWSWVAGLNMR